MRFMLLGSILGCVLVLIDQSGLSRPYRTLRALRALEALIVHGGGVGKPSDSVAARKAMGPYA